MPKRHSGDRPRIAILPRPALYRLASSVSTLQARVLSVSTLYARVLTANHLRQTHATSGDGRDNRDRLAVPYRCAEPLEEPDVLVGDEHVHEPAEIAVLLEESVGEARVGRIESGENLAHGRAVELKLAGPPGEWPQLGRDAYRRAHEPLGPLG